MWPSIIDACLLFAFFTTQRHSIKAGDVIARRFENKNGGIAYHQTNGLDSLSCIVHILSSINEKANCIAIFWTGRPHSLGSCHFRDVWATCLLHKGGGVPLSVLPKDTTSEVAGLFSTISHKCRAPSREAVDTIF